MLNNKNPKYSSPQKTRLRGTRMSARPLAWRYIFDGLTTNHILYRVLNPRNLKNISIFGISVLLFSCATVQPIDLEENHVAAKTLTLEITKEIQFGKRDGEASILRCAITAPIGKWNYSAEITKAGEKSKCFGPVPMWATSVDGKINFNCNGHKINRHICYGGPNKYFINTIAGVRYLKKNFADISVKQTNGK